MVAQTAISLGAVLLAMPCLWAAAGDAEGPAHTEENWREIEDFEQITWSWMSRVSRQVRKRDTIAEKMEWDALENWRKKVMALKQFFGEKTEAEVAFTPLEKHIFQVFEHARATEDMFLRKEWPREDRIKANEKLVYSSCMKEEPYKSLVAELQAWLDREYAEKVTPKQIRDAEMKRRSEMFFDNFESTVYFSNRDPVTFVAKYEPSELGPIIITIYQRFRALGLYDSETVKPVEATALTAREQVFYRYYLLARKHNPIFSNLDTQLDGQEAWDNYQAYVKARVPEEEALAYDAAVAEVKRALGEADPAPPKQPEKEQPANEPPQIAPPVQPQQTAATGSLLPQWLIWPALLLVIGIVIFILHSRQAGPRG